MSQTNANIIYDAKGDRYLCQGDWSVIHLNDLIASFKSLPLPSNKAVELDGESITSFDTAGALALHQCISILKEKGHEPLLKQFRKAYCDLFELIQHKEEAIEYEVPLPKKNGFLYVLGRETMYKLHQADGLIILIGDLTTRIFEAFANFHKFQWPSIVSVIFSAGIQALPIVGLLSFLIGVVLAYQLGQQLESYGAVNFIPFLTGIANFREFGPLITAIIVAGRTSSAFTAQLGSMKINEEIDALRTMGLSPTQLLVLPKVIGLLLVFPLLIFWADIFANLGSMFMSKHMLGVGYGEFLAKLQDSVGLKHMMLGLYKAPTFAIVIALVGCFQGFAVEANADNLGKQTTKAVVQALFLIIIVDAAYSIIYSWMGL